MKALENRIPPPLMVLATALAMAGLAWLSPSPGPLGAPRAGLAAVLFVIAALYGVPAVRAFVRARTTIDPVHIDRASTLVATGIYNRTRNPMYVAMTWLLLSWAVFLASPLALLGPVVFVLYITRFQIMPEERAMAEKFGADYLAYKRRVRRWV